MSEKRNSKLLGKITIFFVICCLVMPGFVANTAAALDGSGTEQDPWRIKSLEDFNDFAADPNFWDDYTRLETDLNLAGLTYTTAVIAPDIDNSNYGFDGTPFTGVFDGNDHKILNLTIDDAGTGNDSVGLFGYIDGGEVSNLGLEGGSVSGSGMVVGGLAGAFREGTISNCYSTGDVNGGGTVGGLIGIAVGGSWISNCYSTGDVSGTGDHIGGMVGYIEGVVSNCYSTGNVNGVDYVGGLVGQNVGSDISNCYSTGDVNGVELVGGLVGWNGGGFWNCYSTGDVNGVNYVGGLIGSNYGYIRDCFWDIETSGESNMCGNESTRCDNSYGKTTAEMHQQSTFTDWDFINVWDIGENQTYPYLRKYLPANLNKDQKVDFLDIRILCEQWLQEQ